MERMQLKMLRLVIPVLVRASYSVFLQIKSAIEGNTVMIAYEMQESVNAASNPAQKQVPGHSDFIVLRNTVSSQLTCASQQLL
jgi:hypothetical protein